MIVVLAVSLASPVFVRIGGPTLVWLPDAAAHRAGGFDLPISAFLVTVAALWLMAARSQQRLPRLRLRTDRPAAAFAAVASLALCVGLFTRHDLNAGLYFAQTVGPLGAYYVASRLVRSERQGFRVLATITVAAVVSAALIFGQSLVSRGPFDVFGASLEDHVGPLNIYQANDYVPFTFAIVYLMALCCAIVRNQLNATFAMALFVLLVVALGLYARGPVLVLMMGLGVLVVATWRDHQSRVPSAIALTVAGFALATVLGFDSMERVSLVGARLGESAWHAVVRSQPASPTTAPTPNPSTGIVPPTQQLTPDQSSNETRLTALAISTSFVLRNPLFGSGFAPIPWQELSPIVRALAPTRLYPTHNQYLDLALRGGIPLLLVFLWLVVAVVGAASRVMRFGETAGARSLGAVMLTVLVPALIVGNMYQNNFTQPFSAFLLWFLLGMSAGLSQIGTRGSTP